MRAALAALLLQACVPPSPVIDAGWQAAAVQERVASATPASDGAIDLETAITLALQRRASMVAAGAREEAADAGLRAARAWEAPQLRVQVQDLGAITGPPGTDIALRSPIRSPIEAHAEALSARAEQSIARAGAVGAAWEIRAAVTEAWGEVQAGRGVAQAWASAERASAAVLQRTVDRRAEGLVTELDVARDQQDLLRVQVGRAEASTDLALVLARLRALTGWSGAAADLSEAPPAPLPADLGEARLLALQHHPLTALLQADLQAAHADLYGAQAAAIPWLDWVQAGVQLRPGDPDGAATASVGVGLTLPLWSWGTGERQAAASSLRAAEADLRAAAQEVLDEVDAAWAAWVAADEAARGLASWATPPGEVVGDRMMAERIAAERARMAVRLAQVQADRIRAGWWLVVLAGG